MVATSEVRTLSNERRVNRVEFTGGSIQSRVLAATLRNTVRPAINIWALAPHLPWPYQAVDHLGRLLRLTRGTTHRSVSLPNCSAEITRPENVLSDRHVIYMHGGAFIVGGRYLHRQLISKLAASLHSEVLAVDYRMLPKHTITDGVEDCVDAYRYALAQGVPPEKIAFMGDSAGAYLVFMTALVAREQGLPMPGAIVSMAPVVDLDLFVKLDAPSARTDALFTQRFALAFHGFVMRRCAEPETRRLPIDEDLTGLSPSLIQVSSTELLYPDAELMANELAKAGVPHQLQVWHNQIHVFQAAASIVPEAARALVEVTQFVEATFAANARQQTA
ncbi:alpha/beta hydrolase [Smaragdicoccus niigatensis]|uniref:alpha/beta hydrolase n=1 Tax=Smaragdicoccus niigatensis TaxID=359359 RepID=UPI00037949E9|nr:alpha/beta hydrolase fold domain-containing protein [Smaragdicoccus niigatensis]